jgi:polyisoprenoid-binding protein YceI
MPDAPPAPLLSVLELILVLGLALFVLAGSRAAHAQTARHETAGKELRVHPKSQFWIQGEASSIDFTCAVTSVEGHAALPPARGSVPTSADREDQTEVVVTVPVRAFDCGNSRMTRDLQDALKMEEHPKIRFELIHATVKTALDTSAQWRRVEVLGALTIAGTKRLTRLSAAGRALDANHFRVRGCHPIRMTYYNIDPPTKAFGLIKVQNEVDVQFDLLAVAEAADRSNPFSSVPLAEAPSCPSASDD